MVEPSVYIAENYIFRDKSYTGSFPIYIKNACVIPTQYVPENLDEEKPIVYSEDGKQGFLYTF